MNQKICNAKSKRTGEQCKAWAITGSTKCRTHGGKTPKGIASPHFKTGKHSKSAYLPDAFRQRFNDLVVEVVKNVEDSIKIQATMESTLLEKLGTTESSRAWEKLHEAVREYDDATHSEDAGKKALGQAQAFGKIRFIVKEGLSETFLMRDIQSMQDSQRKNAETLAKIKAQELKSFTADEVMQFVEVIKIIIRQNVSDRKQSLIR